MIPYDGPLEEHLKGQGQVDKIHDDENIQREESNPDGVSNDEAEINEDISDYEPSIDEGSNDEEPERKIE
jgi:hypothetical protein